MANEVPFIRMDGLGNEFIIFDGITHAPIRDLHFSPEIVRQLNTSHHFDQLIVMLPYDDADCLMQIFNADGSQVEACGNASRCVAWLLTAGQPGSATIQTLGAALECEITSNTQVRINMGTVSNFWQRIPLSKDINTMHLPIEEGPLSDGVAMNVGNPHAVFFVDDIDTIDLQTHGPAIQANPLFTEGVNVSIAQIISDSELTMRTFERGVGETKACGTGACATVAAAHHRKLTNASVTTHLPGGDLQIDYLPSQAIFMTGSVSAPEYHTMEWPDA